MNEGNCIISHANAVSNLVVNQEVKKFENESAYGKDKAKIIVAPFSRHVHTSLIKANMMTDSHNMFQV